MYKHFFKPVIDFILSFVFFVISFPFFIIVWGLLFISNKGKVFFIQPRPGKGGKIFNAIKFKTMNDRRDENGTLLPDGKRLTGVGKFVRKTSLDEIPQLINVMKGEMSLIGPRPWLVEYLPHYNDFQNRRHEVKPGITGWAQVNGRNLLGWEDRFKYDIYYVDHCSFTFDMKIIWLTISKILSASGVSGKDQETMEKFKGNNS